MGAILNTFGVVLTAGLAGGVLLNGGITAATAMIVSVYGLGVVFGTAFWLLFRRAPREPTSSLARTKVRRQSGLLDSINGAAIAWLLLLTFALYKAG